MKFVDGVMSYIRDFINYYIDIILYYVLFRSYMLGVKVKMMLFWDLSVKNGFKKFLFDYRSIVDFKDEMLFIIFILRIIG